MKIITKNLPYYSICLLLFVGLKFGYTIADNSDLLFLLQPTTGLIQWILNEKSQFFIETGYYFSHLNITIDKSCSGFNFWLLCFIMLVFLVMKFLTTVKQKVVALPLLLFGTYLLTIFVNASRILLAIFIQQAALFDKEIPWLHQAEGIFVYLFFLIALYIGFETLLNKTYSPDEKLT